MRIRLFAFLLIVSAAFAVAQTEKSTLRGVVTDQSSAVVPGADIIVTDLITNIEVRRLLSDANGNFEVPDLKPGTYRVKVDMAGFRSFVADSVKLDAGQIRRVDISLQVGATSETVTVTSGAALIQTETGTISGELDQKKFLDRPLVDVYPSPLALMTTMPGIQGNGWNLVMSGISDRNKQTWAMDGVANDTAGDQNDNPSFFETVQVTPVNGGADSARATNFNMISKRGTNAWHAAAYYKHENAGLNAREYFSARKTPYIFHEAEAEVNGPIWKDRTWFFFAWFHQTIPLGSFVNASVPTALMRDGNFSQFLPGNTAGNKAVTIKDPLTGLAFANNIIPASRFSDVSKKMRDLYIPTPNQGTGDTMTNNSGFSFPYNSDLYKGDWPYFRIDHKLSEKNNVYVRWMRRKTPYVRPSSLPVGTYTQARDHRQLVASDTHVFSPTIINTFTFGHQTDFLLAGEEEKGVKPLTGDVVVAALGLQGVNPKGYKSEGFPDTSISGLSTVQLGGSGGVDNIDQNNGIDTYIDTLTWSKGKHVLKFGGEYRKFWWLSGIINRQVYGSFNFNGSFSGNGWADFLLGIPFTSNRLDPLYNRRNTNKQWGFFVNDSFKVSQKLTIDWGLRWDYYGEPTFADGMMFNWDQATGNLIVSQQGMAKIHPAISQEHHHSFREPGGEPEAVEYPASYFSGLQAAQQHGNSRRLWRVYRNLVLQRPPAGRRSVPIDRDLSECDHKRNANLSVPESIPGESVRGQCTPGPERDRLPDEHRQWRDPAVQSHPRTGAQGHRHPRILHRLARLRLQLQRQRQQTEAGHREIYQRHEALPAVRKHHGCQ